MGVTETEIKYESEPDVALPAFSQLSQVARAEEAEQEQLDAEYFDTDDLRLIRAGVTLRRRRGGHDAGWHLKLPAGKDARREIRMPLGRSRRQVPPALARLVTVHARGRELQPVARISTVRTRQLLLDGDGTELAEVASDDVTAQAFGDAARVSQWHEVEVELTGGGRDVLDAADRLMRQAGIGRAAQSSKLARVLDVPADRTGQRQVRGGRASAGDVVLAYADAQVSALKAYDPLVRGNEPDAVHQMRTTTRRLRSTLQTFSAFLSLAESSDLVDELRWLGGELGAARDAEVLAGHIEGQLRELPAELVVGPVAARVRGHFAKLGADAQAGVVSALDSGRYFALLDRLDELVGRTEPSDLGRRPAVRALPAAVRKTYRRTRRRMKRALRQPAGPGQPEERREVALHEARKAAKRARYAGEAVAPVLGRDADRFAKQMKKLQSALGEHQDAVIARGATRELGMGAHLAGENAFTYGLLYDRDDQAASRARKRGVRTWRSAQRRRYRRWLH
jgi:CHAD domain-containing protein